MRTITIPDPPTLEQHGGNMLSWARAQTAWAQRMKGMVQTAINDNAKPCGQQFIAQDYNLNTVASGTYAAVGDLADVVASLVYVLTQKGILSPTVTREQ